MKTRYKECPNCSRRYFNVNKRKCHAKDCGSCNTPYVLSGIRFETSEETTTRHNAHAEIEARLQALLS